MSGFFHRNQRLLLIIVTIVIIIAFVFLFNFPVFEYASRNQLGSINGKTVTQEQFASIAQELRFDWELKSGERLPAGLEDRILRETWQILILESEAQKLGVSVTDDEVAQVIVRMPDFQTDGKFDEAKYNQFVTYTLVANRLNRHSLENIIRRQLLVRKMQLIIGSTAKSTPQEIERAFLMDVERPVIQYVVLNKDDYRKQVKPLTENELKSAFAEYAHLLKRGEQRRIEFVKFTPTAGKTFTVTDEEIGQVFARAQGRLVDRDGKPMTDKAARDFIRKELQDQKRMQDALEQANHFAARFVPDDKGKLPDFNTLAKENNLPVVESGWIFRRDPVKGLENSEIFSRTAFALNQDFNVSDPIPVGGGSFAVLRLVEVAPEQPMEFDEAKGQLSTILTDQALNKLLSNTAREYSEKIEKAVASGKTFEQATAELKLRVISPKPVALAEAASLISADISDEERAARQTALLLPVGAVSGFIPTENGGIISTVKSRELPDEKTLRESGAQFARGYTASMQRLIFNEWITGQMTKEGIPDLEDN
ncbi:SurA N-terminal domain-containing protein [Kamptonema cortianum]|nr:SurA N-terminal domain-containing protein [Oscillatoria laete-virens]MDK3156460.1 SurA N-terminal domain-containing protein [Kamptonema cortianum]MDL5053856.1 SurA N-terminal domain-containing protein [Oscillatoria laete-virens NRMC-F 0139]